MGILTLIYPPFPSFFFSEFKYPPASGELYRLLINFANSLVPDQDRRSGTWSISESGRLQNDGRPTKQRNHLNNVGPHLDPNR